jgi:hypothetical protein
MNAMPWPKNHQVPQKAREWRMTSYHLYHSTAPCGMQSLGESREWHHTIYIMEQPRFLLPASGTYSL